MSEARKLLTLFGVMVLLQGIVTGTWAPRYVNAGIAMVAVGLAALIAVAATRPER